MWFTKTLGPCAAASAHRSYFRTHGGPTGHRVVHCSHCSRPVCFSCSLNVSLADVEARRAAVREAGRGPFSPSFGPQPCPHGSSSGAQHVVAPRGAAADAGPAHLPHDPRSSGRVRLLRVDRAHPHLPSGNCKWTVDVKGRHKDRLSPKILCCLCVFLCLCPCLLCLKRFSTGGVPQLVVVKSPLNWLLLCQ